MTTGRINQVTSPYMLNKRSEEHPPPHGRTVLFAPGLPESSVPTTLKVSCIRLEVEMTNITQC